MANKKGNTSQNRNGHSRDAGYGTSSSPGRRTQNVRRTTSGGRRNPTPKRGRANKHLYTNLGFWVVICTLIIVIVLIVKGCDTGNIDADKMPSAESLAAPSEKASQGQSSQSGSQSSGAAGVPSPTSGSQPTTTAKEPTQSTTQPAYSAAQPTTPNKNYYEEHEINAGVYLIGADIPAGTADLTAMSGTGSISTSNGSFKNPTFGNADSYTKYSEKIVLNSGTNLTVTGSLILRISYFTKPEIGASQSSPGTKNYTLSQGTHTAGENFESGTYDFEIVSGYGTVTSSNSETGEGIDEMMGPADNGGNYAQKVSGISLPAGTVLTVNGCTVKITKRD